MSAAPRCWVRGTPRSSSGGPRAVLLVNESTLLLVLMPLAPAAMLTNRVGEHVAVVLTAHHTPRAILDQEAGTCAPADWARPVTAV